MKPRNILETLTPEEQEEVYRAVRMQHVLNDVAAYAKEHDIELTKEQAKEVARRYAYEGRYDCNLSYWENIESLVTEVRYPI